MNRGARSRLPAMREPTATYSDLDGRTKRFILGGGVTLFATIVVIAYLMPFGYMAVTALKSEQQISDPARPVLPRSQASALIDGEELPLLTVPLPDGTTRELALSQPGRQASTFVDPSTGETIEWDGVWRQLDPVYELDLQFDNFTRAWDSLDFIALLRNTGIIAGVGMALTVVSSTIVAYGISRFRIPFKGLIVGSLVATIILPKFVTLVPTYAVFERLGMIGTWWPLLIPHLFGNAYNVFLLRQFFLTIPRDLDDAAAIDGAGPLRVLWSIVLPQARPAIMAVALFHFFFAWNDFFEPLVYLAGRRDLLPISVGMYDFLGLYDSQQELVQAGALIGMAIPLVIFAFGQRFFLRGIDLSGAIK